MANQFSFLFGRFNEEAILRTGPFSRGTGLGLWLTRDIVQRNWGRLRYRSRVDSPSGTVFTIYLPSGPPRSTEQQGGAGTQTDAASSGSKEQERNELEAA